MKTRLVSVAAFAALLSFPFVVSAQEKPAKGPFAKADADGNGELSRAEFGTLHKGRRTEEAVDKIFARLDTDDNKAVSRAEFRAGAKKAADAAKNKRADGGKKKPQDG